MEPKASSLEWCRLISNFGSREIGGRRRATKGRKSCKGTHRARVWSINHVVPGDRWTLGSMETPHNWENSAGLLVDRAHGHLSCRDRAPIDGSARFELTPVKSRVARLGKSVSFDLSRLHTERADARDRYRTAVFLFCNYAALPVHLVIGNKYRYHWTHAPAWIFIQNIYIRNRSESLSPFCACFKYKMLQFSSFSFFFTLNFPQILCFSWFVIAFNK